MLLALLYALLRVLIDLLILRDRSTADRDLELLVLRQELLVLRRTAPPPHWRTADRMILAALGRKLSAAALLVVQPATVLGRRHLQAVLAEYVEHYNGHRPHRSLELRPPHGSTVIPALTGGEVVRRTRVHGLINEYSRRAA